MAEKLPGVNFQAPVSTDDLEFQQTSNSEEIQERTRLSIRGEFGIVDGTDPRDVSVLDLSRPLNVLPSTDPLKVDVNAGTAVTECGNWTRLDNKIFLFELASVVLGAVNVIYIEYALEESEDRRLNKFLVDVAVREQRPADNNDVIRVTTLANFTNESLFPPVRKSDLVVLAVVTVVEQADGSLSLAIDTTDNNFEDVRPWYSPVDIRHREMVGTADPTSTNPHGTSLNDLAVGKLTLYQQTLSHGMVLSKDVAVSKMPGLKAIEPIQAASVQIDTTGEITRRSTLYGGPGAQFANLQHFPIRLGSVYETGVPAIQLSADFVPDESILVLPAGEPIPEAGITVEYLWASAGEAPVDPSTNDLTYLQPADSELIVADGIAVTAIPAPVITFDGSGPIPRDFRVFIDSDGTLVKSPQIMLAATKLDALIGVVDIAASMQGEAPIEIGMTRAANVTGMVVTIRCTGLGTNDQPLSEDLSLFFPEYSDTALPGTSENPGQFARSTAVFKELQTIEVVERENDGNDTQIVIYAAQEAHITDTFNELCPLTDVFWDGLSLDNVQDTRPVRKDLHLPRTPIFNGAGAMEPGSRAWFYEDLREPRFIDSFEGDAAPTSAIGTLSIPNNQLITDGDTIDLGNGKVLTAKVPLPATGSLGALDFGVEVPPGERTFTVDETPSGGGVLNVTVPAGTFSLEDLCVQLANSLNGQSTLINYTCSVLSSRIFTISGTNTFDLPSPTSLNQIMQFSAGAGQSNYTGTALTGLADGDLFVISDGSTELTFEFDTGGGVATTSEAVPVAPNALAPAVQTAMITAVNDATFDVSASPGASNIVNLENDNPGADGNALITESITTGSTLNPQGMDGGTDGGADPTVGEYNVGADTDADTTADNIVTTLADPTFDSGVTGTAAEVSGVPGVELEKNVPALANNAIVLTQATPIPSPIVATGFERGTDRYLGVSPDAFAEGLRTRIPSLLEDTDDVRRKYRSRAIGVPIDFSSDIEEISVVVHTPENVSGAPARSSIQVRAAFLSDPGNWQNYSQMDLTQLNPNLAIYAFDFGVPIQKVQFEMFGQFTDFAVCDITNLTAVGGGGGATGPTGATGPEAPVRVDEIGVSTTLTEFMELVLATAGGITLTLPDATAAGVDEGKVYWVKDRDGNAEASPITIATTGGQTINSLSGVATTFVMTVDRMAIALVSDGANWQMVNNDPAFGPTGPAGATGQVSSQVFTDTFSSGTVHVFNHNLGTENVLVAVYDDNGERLIPAIEDVTSENVVTITLSVATSGRVVIFAEA